MTKQEAMDQYKELHNKPNKFYTPKSFQNLVIDNYLGIKALYEKDETLIKLLEEANILLCAVLSQKELEEFYKKQRTK